MFNSLLMVVSGIISNSSTLATRELVPHDYYNMSVCVCVHAYNKFSFAVYFGDCKLMHYTGTLNISSQLGNNLKQP